MKAKKSSKLILMAVMLVVATSMVFTPVSAATKTPAQTKTPATKKTPAPAKNSAPVIKFYDPEATKIDTVADMTNGIGVSATDANGDVLTFAVSVKPKHGTVNLYKPTTEGTGAARVYFARVEFTPQQGSKYTGKDSFTVVVKDSKGAKMSLTVPIEIHPGSPPEGL